MRNLTLCREESKFKIVFKTNLAFEQTVNAIEIDALLKKVMGSLIEVGSLIIIL